MKIKMLVSTAGVDFALSPGEETDRFSDNEATRMIEAGQAVLVGEPTVVDPVKPPAGRVKGWASKIERAVKSAAKIEKRD
jgi:hypothetical protein